MIGNKTALHQRANYKNKTTVIGYSMANNEKNPYPIVSYKSP